MVKCWLQWSGVSEAADLGPVDVEVVGVERGHLQTVQVLQKFLDFIWKFFLECRQLHFQNPMLK